jgi:hypothetical protein
MQTASRTREAFKRHIHLFEGWCFLFCLFRPKGGVLDTRQSDKRVPGSQEGEQGSYIECGNYCHSFPFLFSAKISGYSS